MIQKNLGRPGHYLNIFYEIIFVEIYLFFQTKMILVFFSFCGRGWAGRNNVSVNSIFVSSVHILDQETLFQNTLLWRHY